MSECMTEISDDELEAMLERKPTVREAKVDDHALMVKALEHPVRRKMIKTIGVFGKTKHELKKEVGVDDAMLNFQIDFLIKGNYLKVEGDNYRLNDRGLVLLSNIPK
jgi:predicted transcriptional regulator